MIKLRILILCTFFSICTLAQNTATNFITDDCSGITHNLFDSLDAGNIIVIAWVMPCGPCATYAYEAYSAVQYFGNSKIKFYLVDDFANTSCANLVGWGNTNNMPLNNTFSSSDISMTDYGSIGMPKVVVLSGNDHAVYYNENNSQINYDDVMYALVNALEPPSSINEVNDRFISLNCFPNPARNILSINCSQIDSDEIIFQVVDILGNILYNHIDNKHTNLKNLFFEIDISTLDQGQYFLSATTNSNRQTISFFVE